MIEITECPICGHEKFKTKHEVKDFSASQEMFNIVECSNCDFLFTNPRPKNEEIGEYYKSQNYISHTNQKGGLFGSLYQVFRKKAISNKLKWIEKNSGLKKGNILDYGSGTGEFLSYCTKAGWKTKGVEIAEGPRNSSIDAYGLDVVPPNQIEVIQAESMDVITMWHVLEHIDNLQESFKAILSKLKKGGYMFIALPNPESWDAIRYKEFWAAWDVPIHFYHFKKRDITELAQQHGLQLLSVLNMPFDSFYVSLLSEEYKTGKKNWLNATKSGLVSNIKGRRQNASSLTYVLRKG